jgi:cytochrome P450
VMGELWRDFAIESECETSSGAPKASGSLPKGEELSLLDRVIKESMRILPASAYSQRMTSEAVQLGPFQLSRGTGIVFTPLIVHHLADLYPEPERFLPDRWINLRPSPYAYHPFGAGPRLCIGAPLATAIIRVALKRILMRYRLAVVPDSKIGVHVESTMLFPTYGLPMEIHEANGNYVSSPVTGNIHELVELDGADSPSSTCDREPNSAGMTAAPCRPR